MAGVFIWKAMEYTTERLNRATGDMEEIRDGDWITVTELGKKYGAGRNRVREVLHHIGLLWPEGKHGRYRLPYDAVARGLGKRIEAGNRRKFPFDVLSPGAQALIATQWDTAVAELAAEKSAVPNSAARLFADFQERRRSKVLQTGGQVRWYLDHFPDLRHEEIATLIGVSQPMVSRHARQRAKQKQFLRDRVERQSNL
jgi:hypothetical protein